jgi:hypothetical protein
MSTSRRGLRVKQFHHDIVRVKHSKKEENPQ